MFTWVCPKCGREVPPAYDECPDCAAKAAAGALTGSATAPPGAFAPPQQSMPGAPPPGPRGGRRPLWATGPQEPLAPAPPQVYTPPPPSQPAPPPPMAAYPPEAPPVFRPQPAMSPMFQPSAPAAPEYLPPPAGPRQPAWLTGVAIGVIVVMIVCAWYWFFGRSQSTSAVIETPAVQPGAAAENPLQKYIEITGLRFGSQSKGVQVTFVLVNHSDSDVVGLTGTATIVAKTEKGGEETVGTVDLQTSMAAQSSKELTLPLNTKLKLMEMPDWQNAKVTVKITSPTGS